MKPMLRYVVVLAATSLPASGPRAQAPVAAASLMVPRDTFDGPDPNAFHPFRLGVVVSRLDSTTVAAIDSIALLAHGYAFSHIDALSHVAFRERLYNVMPRDQLAPEGARTLGVEAMRGGIVTRGVIVDIPRLKRLAYMPAGTAVTQPASWTGEP